MCVCVCARARTRLPAGDHSFRLSAWTRNRIIESKLSGLRKVSVYKMTIPLCRLSTPPGSRVRDVGRETIFLYVIRTFRLPTVLPCFPFKGYLR